MENASKALLIAGSILIAIIILSLIVYMSTTTSRMMQEQDKKKSEQEIFEFNKEYGAYNKELMYGTDVITVMKKAIDYNQNTDKKIIIELTTINSYATVIEITKTSKSGTETKEKIKTTDSLNIGTYNQDDSTMQIFLEQEPKDYYDKDNSTENTKVYVYSALTSFKRSIFKCTGTEYDQDGRITKMSFEEIKNFSEI